MVSKLSEALERIEQLEEEIALEAVAVEAHCSHVVMSWVDYPGGRVGLDAAGNMVRVELDLDLHGWAVER